VLSTLHMAVGYMGWGVWAVWACGVTPYVRHSTDCTCCDFGYLNYLVTYVILATYFPENKSYDVTGLTSGMYKEVLSTLETELNFTTRQYKRQDGVWGLVTVDTSTGTLISTGMLADITSGNADIIATSLAIQIERSFVVDYLSPINSDYAALVILNDEIFDDLEFVTYFKTLSNHVWLVIVILAFWISIFLYLYKNMMSGKNTKTVRSAINVGSSYLHFIFHSRDWCTFSAFYGQV
jgi:hypothetical protein